MKRRAFIKTGLATAAVGAISANALGEIFVPLNEDVSHPEMMKFFGEMDLSMERISQAGGKFLKELIPFPALEMEQNFIKSSLRSLLLVGNFGSLSTKGQVHPGMQDRLNHAAPDLNFSVNNSIEILSSLDDESMAEIQFALKEEPDLGVNILEALDNEAQAIGIPRDRRRQLRVLGSRMLRRLRHSPDMLINEYLNKADKLMSAGDSEEALEKMLRTKLGDSKFNSLKNEAEKGAVQWKDLDLPDTSIGYDPIISEYPTIDAKNGPPDPKIRKFLIVLGIGAAITGIGWLFLSLEVALGAGLIMGITVGPLLIVIALLALIIILITKAVRRR